jgi:GDP-4-dehydro-6-deoxy-D-mannose reductase
VDVFGISRRPHWATESRHLADWVTLLACDLCDGSAVLGLLEQIEPQRIFHLAGYAHPGQSFRDADSAWNGNLTATRTLYEAVQRWGGRPRILYVSSGLIYGDLEGERQAHHEDDPLRPVSPYAASKAAADLASYQYTRAPGLDIVRVRPFNHFGPRQSPQYAVAHFARQIAAIEREQQPPVLETGNLTSVRDLTDVRDMVQAYLLLMERGRTSEAYNAASGAVYSMQTVLEHLLALARVPIQVRQQPRLVRATETAIVRADAGKLRRETDWKPHFRLDQSLADTLDYWRRQP